MGCVHSSVEHGLEQGKTSNQPGTVSSKTNTNDLGPMTDLASIEHQNTKTNAGGEKPPDRQSQTKKEDPVRSTLHKSVHVEYTENKNGDVSTFKKNENHQGPTEKTQNNQKETPKEISKHDNSSEVFRMHRKLADDMKQKITELENEVLQLQEEKRILEAEHKANVDKLRESFEDEKRKLMIQLSGDMARKIAANEHDLEDISRPNRPMKIAENYTQFCSEHWLKMKEKLDKKFDTENNTFEDNIKLMLLNTVLLESYKHACLFREKCLTTIAAKTGETLKMQEKAGRSDEIHWQEFKVKFPDFSSALEIFVRDHMPTDMEFATDFKSIWTSSADQLSKSISPKTSQTLKKLGTFSKKTNSSKKYISACINLSLRMVTQLPPMTFEVPGINEPYQGDAVQDVYYTSRNPKDPKNVVILYVLPSIYHGSHMMARGHVICGPADWLE